jgi:hypothetical protein
MIDDCAKRGFDEQGQFAARGLFDTEGTACSRTSSR